MSSVDRNSTLPLPPHYDANRVGEVWRVPYQERALQAQEWARRYEIQPAIQDKYRMALLGVDVQNTFCIPGFELYVAGRSGKGAVEDSQRLCEFIYRNLHVITHIVMTMDTHQVIHIFHPIFLINEEGKHPDALTSISYQDIIAGRWRFNEQLSGCLDIEAEYGQQHLLHYVRALKKRGKYDLTIWPYHAMLGGIGHALVSTVEEAIFFHSIVRNTQADFEMKGRNPLTEHYSAINPEVVEGPGGEKIAEKSDKFIKLIKEYDAVLIAGQAKSHCVSWTIEDILEDIRKIDSSLARKVYLLEDCTSPVVIPGVVDYSKQAEAKFREFAEAGMHIVRTTEPIQNWPGIELD